MPKQQTVTVTWYTLAEKVPEENSHIYFRDNFDSHIMDGYFYNGGIDSHWPVYMRPEIEWCYAHELETMDGTRTDTCPYCETLDEHNEGADITDKNKGWTDLFHIRKDTDGLYRIACYADESSPINFCPMCRRDLTEEQLAPDPLPDGRRVCFGPYLTPVRIPRNPDAPPLWLDLSDGTTLPGVYMDIVKIVDVPNDRPTVKAEETSWLLVILSDTLGFVNVDARHVVRIGTDPSNPVSVKSPADVAKFVETFRSHEP